MRSVPPFPTDALEIVAWPDEVIDLVGHDPHADYVERYWLGVLGPSTTWLLRHLAAELSRRPDGFSLDLEDCARRLGVGMRGGRQSPFVRALGRLVQFEMAQLQGPSTLAVRTKVPDLSRRHLLRLPESLQRQHDQWLTSRLAPIGSGS